MDKLAPERWYSLKKGDIIVGVLPLPSGTFHIVETAHRKEGVLTLRNLFDGEKVKLTWTDTLLPVEEDGTSYSHISPISAVFSSEELAGMEKEWKALKEGDYLNLNLLRPPTGLIRVIKKRDDRGLMLSYGDKHQGVNPALSPSYWDEKNKLPMKDGRPFAPLLPFRVVTEEDLIQVVSSMKEAWHSLEPGDSIVVKNPDSPGSEEEIAVLDSAEDGLTLSMSRNPPTTKVFQGSPCRWDDENGIVSFEGVHVTGLSDKLFSVKKGGAMEILEHYRKKFQPSIKLSTEECGQIISRHTEEIKDIMESLNNLNLQDAVSIALDRILGEGNYNKEQLARIVSLILDFHIKLEEEKSRFSSLRLGSLLSRLLSRRDQ